MEPIVLVTYATRYGSTEEVALGVAQTLREGGVAVETQPVRSVHFLERYAPSCWASPYIWVDFTRMCAVFCQHTAMPSPICPLQSSYWARFRQTRRIGPERGRN